MTGSGLGFLGWSDNSRRPEGVKSFDGAAAPRAKGRLLWFEELDVNELAAERAATAAVDDRLR